MRSRLAAPCQDHRDRLHGPGPDGLRSHGPTDPIPRLSDAQLHTVELALREGAIERLTGVRQHPTHVAIRAGSDCRRGRRGP
jgi:hypothetical protein